MREAHIAFFGSSTAVDGGSELCLLRMARNFHSRFRVTLFLPDPGPLYQEATSSGIEVVNLDFPACVGTGDSAGFAGFARLEKPPEGLSVRSGNGRSN